MAHKSLVMIIEASDDAGYNMNAYAFSEAPVPVDRLFGTLRSVAVVDPLINENDPGYEPGRTAKNNRSSANRAGLDADIAFVLDNSIG